jgi:hypothetical protein
LFFLRKEQDAKRIFKDYFSCIKVITTSPENLHTAILSSFNDIEDAFHYYSAIDQVMHSLLSIKKILFNMKIEA